MDGNTLSLLISLLLVVLAALSLAWLRARNTSSQSQKTLEPTGSESTTAEGSPDQSLGLFMQRAALLILGGLLAQRKKRK